MARALLVHLVVALVVAVGVEDAAAEAIANSGSALDTANPTKATLRREQALRRPLFPEVASADARSSQVWEDNTGKQLAQSRAGQHVHFASIDPHGSLSFLKDDSLAASLLGAVPPEPAEEPAGSEERAGEKGAAAAPPVGGKGAGEDSSAVATAEATENGKPNAPVEGEEPASENPSEAEHHSESEGDADAGGDDHEGEGADELGTGVPHEEDVSAAEDERAAADDSAPSGQPEPIVHLPCSRTTIEGFSNPIEGYWEGKKEKGDRSLTKLECVAKCMENEKCRRVAYDNNNTECYMYDTDEGKEVDDGNFDGFIKCYHVRDCTEASMHCAFLGYEMRANGHWRHETEMPDITSPQDCSARCSMDAECNGWTWYDCDTSCKMSFHAHDEIVKHGFGTMSFQTAYERCKLSREQVTKWRQEHPAGRTKSAPSEIPECNGPSSG